MGNPLDNIRNAIQNGNIDQQWQLQSNSTTFKPKIDLSSIQSSKIVTSKKSKPDDSTQDIDFRASYQNPQGNKLLSVSGSNWGGQFRLFSSTFTTTIGNHRVELSDHSSEEDKSIGPDGKISAQDNLTVDGSTYTIKDDGKGYYRLQDFGDSEIAKALNKNKSSKLGQYHDLQFVREGEKWKFFGPPERAAQGKEAEKLMNELQSQYRLELMDAQTHLR